MRVLVETGTYMGETAWALRRDFERIETIELEPTLARLARIRFGRTKNVGVHEGDSAAVLPRILETLDSPALFWLDAHPSTDRTARGGPIPLRSEIAGANLFLMNPAGVVFTQNAKLKINTSIAAKNSMV